MLFIGNVDFLKDVKFNGEVPLMYLDTLIIISNLKLPVFRIANSGETPMGSDNFF